MTTSRTPRITFALGAVVGMLFAGVGLGLVADGPSLQPTVVGGPLSPSATTPEGAPTADGAATPGSVAVGGTAGASSGAGGRGAASAGARGGAGATPGVAGADGAEVTGDRGVTEDTINLAILLADTGGAAAFGIEGNIGDNKLAFEGYVKEINEAGGLNGRTINAEFITYDPFNYDTLYTACTQATEDFESFSVIDLAVYYGPAILCITEQHATPFMTYTGEPDEWYQRSNGLFWGVGISKSRMMRIFANELDRMGILKEHNIGILGTEFPTDRLAIEGHLLPTLDAMGYEYTYFRASQDIATSQAQMPVAVQTMQQAGVDRMILLLNLLGNPVFVQQAEKRLFFPQYLVTDIACGTCDAATATMPESFDGAIGISTSVQGDARLGRPQPAYDAECLRRHEANTGQRVEYGHPADPNYTAAFICTLMDRWADGVRRAGADLTRATWSAAMGATGGFDAVGSLGGSWGPGKHDAPDFIRTVNWYYEHEGERCLCFLPVDEARRATE